LNAEEPASPAEAEAADGLTIFSLGDEEAARWQPSRGTGEARIGDENEPEIRGDGEAETPKVTETAWGCWRRSSLRRNRHRQSNGFIWMESRGPRSHPYRIRSDF